MNVFISVPMKGLTNQQIEDEIEIVCKITETYFPLAKDLEFVTNYGTEPDDIPDTVKKESVWHLGEALKCLSTCDAIMVPNCASCANHGNHGCDVERIVAVYYGIPIYTYDDTVLDEFIHGKFHDESK